MIGLSDQDQAGTGPLRSNVRIRLDRTGEGQGPSWPTNGSAALVALRWVAILFGTVLVARSTRTASSLLWGLPLAAMAFVRTFDRQLGLRRSRLATGVATAVEVGVAAAAVSQTGGWHSGWVATLVGLAGLAGLSMPERWAGQVAAAAVIALVIGNLAGQRVVSGPQMWSLDVDGLLMVGCLSVAYAAWLARFGDRDRAALARTNERLMATNDLLVHLEQVVLWGEDVTDPTQAARAVARLARELLDPDVIVVASAASAGGTWRVLLAEGVETDTIAGAIDEVAMVATQAAAGHPGPVLTLPGAGLLRSESASGVCIPLMVRGRLIGVLVMEAFEADRWSDFHFEVMAELSPWAALLVDNACRFNALWVVGSSEERARVARTLHDSLGQDMAALGLQLDWLARTIPDPEQSARIKELRAGVTGMVAELRYTMKDLCCDVSATRSLAEALQQLVGGIESRSSAEITLEVNGDARLPIAQEHQILQMARVLLGAAVDSGADSLSVRWGTGPEGACLEVGYGVNALVSASPAVGASASAPVLSDAPMSAAVAEVSERCWAVGATMECDLNDGGRRRVRCRVAS